MAGAVIRPRSERAVCLSASLIQWPVCGSCYEVAYFRWMGGAHDCERIFDETERLRVTLPAPEQRVICGTGFRNRVTQQIIIDGSHLAHLKRFFERVQDDDEVDELLVLVRAGGTLAFVGTAGMYSADVGYSEPE
jgi:hypothetical protein